MELLTEIRDWAIAKRDQAELVGYLGLYNAMVELIVKINVIIRENAPQQPNAVDVKNPCCISFEETHPAFLYCGHCGTKLSRH